MICVGTKPCGRAVSSCQQIPDIWSALFKPLKSHVITISLSGNSFSFTLYSGSTFPLALKSHWSSYPAKQIVHLIETGKYFLGQVLLTLAVCKRGIELYFLLGQIDIRLCFPLS